MLESPIKVVCNQLSEVLERAFERINIEMPIVSLICCGACDEMLVKPSTAIEINANVSGQTYEPMAIYTLNLFVRLTVRLCDEAYDSLFTDAHECLWHELFMLSQGDACEALGNQFFACDGFQMGSETQPTLDAAADGGGVITCDFSARLTGRVIKERN